MKGYRERAVGRNKADNYDAIVKSRLVALGYVDESDDSGGGSALSSILSAATSLGSAYVLSQNQPQYTEVPQTTIPAYGTSGGLFGPVGSTGSGSGLLLLGLAFVGVLLLVFAIK